jgi:hypothetical protein
MVFTGIMAIQTLDTWNTATLPVTGYEKAITLHIITGYVGGRCQLRAKNKLNGIGNDIAIGSIAKHHIPRTSSSKWKVPKKIPLTTISLFLLVYLNGIRHASIIVNRKLGIGSLV